MEASDKLFRIVDQRDRVYYSNRFKGYYDTKERAQNALRHLPKRTYVGWNAETKRPMYEDAEYTVQESQSAWRTVD